MNHAAIRNFLLDLFDVVAFLVFVGGIVLFIRFFIFNPYSVVGASMEPTFHENDFIIVDKITPRYGELRRGDVIVFVPPGKDIPYIKRVVAFSGEFVKVKEGMVYICSGDNHDKCFKLDEYYLPKDLKTEPNCGMTEFSVDGSGLFVLGDNRGFSTDSRCCFGLGCYQGASYLVPWKNIIGKVLFRAFPGPRADFSHFLSE